MHSILPLRPPHAFVIRIVPRVRGLDVLTDPYHRVIQEMVEQTLRGRGAVDTDRTTIVAASATRAFRTYADGPIAPKPIRQDILTFAEIGVGELRRANDMVRGYLYDALVGSLLGTAWIQESIRTGSLTVRIAPSVVPCMRSSSYRWWRDMRQVAVANRDGIHIRLCGIEHSEPFVAWGNERIRKRFCRRLAQELGIPVSIIQDRSDDDRGDVPADAFQERDEPCPPLVGDLVRVDFSAHQRR